MGKSLLTNLDPRIISALERRARINGRSAEAEHREILRTTLMPAFECEKEPDYFQSLDPTHRRAIGSWHLGLDLLM